MIGYIVFRKWWQKRSRVFLHFFQNIDFIGFEKDTLKVCSQKFVKTIDKDKSICYNKAKLRDRNKKIKKTENEYKKQTKQEENK